MLSSRWFPFLFAFAMFELVARALLAQPAWDPRVDLRVPIAPAPFTDNGKTHLAYELHLTNFDGDPITLTSIEILRAGGDGE